jgi:protein-disulfide isomerase
MKKFALVATAIVLLLSIFAVATHLYNKQQADEASAKARQHDSVLERDYSPTMGDENAKVTIVEFFDPACETCRDFSPFLKQLMENNPGKIRLVMRYLPLHQGADEVVKILEAAHLQDRYWETLEDTYATQSKWTAHHVAYPETLWEILTYTELDIEKAKQDASSPAVAQRIQQDIADARQLEVRKTPGFFVNGKPLISFGYRQLQDLVESEIRANYQEKK